MSKNKIKLQQRFSIFIRLFYISSFLFILFIFGWGFRYRAFYQKIGDNSLSYYNGQTIKVKAWVCEEASLDYKSRQLIICINSYSKTEKRLIKGRALIKTSLYPVYDYGDLLYISGKLKKPISFKSFNYPSYLALHHIYSVLYYPYLKKVPAKLNIYQLIYRHLLDFKQGTQRIINRHLPEPEASLANAMLLAYRRALYPEEVKTFARVGLSHMLAISGTHISILSALIIDFFLFFGLKRRQSLYFVFIFLVTYPLLTGLSSSAVRASIMGLISFLAIYLKKKNSILIALISAAVLMLIVNPLLLHHDIGFQFSFLVTLGIIYIYPIFENYTNHFLDQRLPSIGKKKIIKNILDIINISIVAQLTILPLALINFKQLSLIAPLANVLVIGLLPWLLSSLIAALILTFFVPVLAIVFFFPVYLILKLMLSISRYLAHFSWVVIQINNFRQEWVWGYYFVLLVFVIIYYWFNKKTVE